ncbi:hypothetical protein H6G20_07230 [Desertifilum sp. FACHB-1129]|uniref:hypothetical protein n=1 Tax=Desertifilum TaxID=1185872 RepID=UPI00114D238D|nr:MULTISPECIES: hypothetical protein [Desertifilum]MBD2311449.1 hypothetical protein [Desertifilum sp. FACHB-1129]MBD2323379.1 hypothetical protein [Desertifilum sp. FACHB-866]MBD2333224.1 hypothetical protein [Desertifilum sp. FACHB-868]MDA0212993.1 hypothetical protein [Cyanobacteria bacterium FC1]
MSVEPLTFHPGDSKIWLPSDSLLAISEQKKSGLILCKTYYAEFVGPGAAVSTPEAEGYTAVITIGSPILVTAQGWESRQRAYGRRIQWMRWLEKITHHSDDPQARVEKLISSFEAFFSSEIVAKIPDDVLALLVGALPQTVRAVRPPSAESASKNDSGAVSCWEPIATPAPVTPSYQLAIAPERTLTKSDRASKNSSRITSLARSA